jgi:hypothetical protein
MAVFIHKKFPAQHAIYGGSAPIAPELNPDNWETCAILRAKQYLYIGVGSWGRSDDESRRYRVDASPDNSLSKDFASLDAAIDYANNLGKEDKELPFKPSSGAYVGIGFGQHREGISIPLKEGK